MIQATIPCNLCGATDVEVIGETDRKGKPLRSVICRSCGLVWTDPRPGTEATRKFYVDDYRLQYKQTYRPKLKHAYREIHRALQRFQRIEPLLRQGMKVLDVGAGGGFFPYTVRHRGYDVVGIEPNRGYARYAVEELQLEVMAGFLQDQEFTDESFDIITLNHVLEHLEDPAAALLRLLRWNKSGGFLNVEVPNVEATYHAPGHKFHLAHLYTFNPENLQMLGRKAGYLVQDMKLMPGTQHINVIFQKPVVPVALQNTAGFTIPENRGRIRAIFDRHTPIRHYFSVKPYARFVRKNIGYLQERIAVSKFRGSREIADYLLSRTDG